MVTRTTRQATQAANSAADEATSKAGKAAGAAPGSLGEALQQLTQALAARGASAVANKVGATASRLSEYAEGGGDGGLIQAFTGGSPVKGALGAGLSGLKEKVKSTTGGGGGGTLKVTNIVENIDVGVPVDVAYDQWTRFTDFPGFMKKVEDVEQLSDERLRWRAKIFWSKRTWESTILDQVPDERIVWRSEGTKGHVDGAVTFHELAPRLTRIVLVLEYHPRGLFEHTGNLWRAQGRRARLELKHFRRHVMTEALLHSEEIEGWRGEIHDAEVVDEDGAERGGEAEGAEPEDEVEQEPEEEAAEPTEEPPPRRRPGRSRTSTSRGGRS